MSGTRAIDAPPNQPSSRILLPTPIEIPTTPPSIAQPSNGKFLPPSVSMVRTNHALSTLIRNKPAKSSANANPVDTRR